MQPVSLATDIVMTQALSDIQQMQSKLAFSMLGVKTVNYDKDGKAVPWT